MRLVRRTVWMLVLSIGLALAGSALAGPILVDVEAWGDNGGYWNNHASNNWQIWLSLDPLTNPTPSFVNIPALNDPISLALGEYTFVMYKENHVYLNHDHGTKFTLKNGNTTGSITVTMSPTDFLSGLPIPPVSPADITLEGVRFSITSYGWLRDDVFSRDRVQPNQPLPNGHLDDIGVFTLTVTPEPCTLALLGLGAAALARRARLRRAA